MVVTLSAKHFAERLNYCLNDTGAPAHVRERAVILSKMIDIPKQQAWAFLEGQMLPEPEMLQRIANEFEVDPKWLCGEK
jgi:hypothetical protein